MIETAPRHDTTAARLDAIAEAYASGDNPLGELLFIQALEDELPWDDACAAAARGIAQHLGGPRRG